MQKVPWSLHLAAALGLPGGRWLGRRGDRPAPARPVDGPPRLGTAGGTGPDGTQGSGNGGDREDTRLHGALAAIAPICLFRP